MKDILTERLYLRAWKPSDGKRLYELAKDPEVGPAAGWPVHTSPANSTAIILTVLSADETYAVCLKNPDGSCGEIIGSVGIKTGNSTDLTDQPDEGELGFWIGRAYWGSGYMPEAVKYLLAHAKDDLHFKRMWCAYYDGNEKSNRAQEKMGFTYRYSVKNYEVKLLNETRDMHVNCIEL